MKSQHIIWKREDISAKSRLGDYFFQGAEILAVANNSMLQDSSPGVKMTWLQGCNYAPWARANWGLRRTYPDPRRKSRNRILTRTVCKERGCLSERSPREQQRNKPAYKELFKIIVTIFSPVLASFPAAGRCRDWFFISGRRGACACKHRTLQPGVNYPAQLLTAAAAQSETRLYLFRCSKCISSQLCRPPLVWIRDRKLRLSLFHRAPKRPLAPVTGTPMALLPPSWLAARLKQQKPPLRQQPGARVSCFAHSLRLMALVPSCDADFPGERRKERQASVRAKELS